jgi:TonB family protein
LDGQVVIWKSICRCGLFVLLLTPFGCRWKESGDDQGTVLCPASSPSGPGTRLVYVAPKYPAGAKAARIQGAVVLHAIIGADGKIESLEAISGPPMLYTAAIDAVKQWVYKPYVINCAATRVDTTITVNFKFEQPK